MEFINKWYNKFYRIYKMMGDKSEVFDDYPSFRYSIMLQILKEK